MTSISISKDIIKLTLTSPRSKVRISDNDGNHIARPVQDGKYEDGYYIEWMITNEEIGELAKFYLNQEDIKGIINSINSITNFLRDSEFYVRKAKKTKLESKFGDFEVYEYKETFYSFEKETELNTRIRVTFKMGDFTLAAHMFVLLPFRNETISLFNLNGKLELGDSLGKCSYALWKPTKEQIESIIIGLAHSSKNHREDLVEILSLH